MWTVYVAPFLGAALFELLNWYRLRETLDTSEYSRLLVSRFYWIVTVLMLIGSGFGSLIYFEGRLGAGELMVAGAAFPALFKKVVAGFIDRETAKLGPADSGKSLLSSYLSVH